ncbi:Glutamate--tRNA ligase, chloroplastic/mitochondrial [Linum perenne]
MSCSPEGKPVIEDKLSEVSLSLLSAYDSGELGTALEGGHSGWKKWVKDFGKSTKRKGKSLFMPLRVLLTGKLHGPDIGGSVVLLHRAGVEGIVGPEVGFLSLEERFRMLREVNWEAMSSCKDDVSVESATAAAASVSK